MRCSLHVPNMIIPKTTAVTWGFFSLLISNPCTTGISTDVLSLNRIINSAGSQKRNTYLVKKKKKLVGIFLFVCLIVGYLFWGIQGYLLPVFSSSPMLNLNINQKVCQHLQVQALNTLSTWNLFLPRKSAVLQKLWLTEIQRCKCQV